MESKSRLVPNGCPRCGGAVTVTEALRLFVGNDEPVPVLRGVVCQLDGPLRPDEYPEGVA